MITNRKIMSKKSRFFNFFILAPDIYLCLIYRYEKTWRDTGATSSNACISCLPGTYSNETGTAVWTDFFQVTTCVVFHCFYPTCGAFYDYKLATNTSKCVNLYPCLAYRVRQLVEPMIVFLNIKLMVSTFYIWSKLSSSRAILFRLLWLLSMSSWVLL